MIDFPYIQSITRKTSSKIIMLVADGLGGMKNPQTGLSELEVANLPNLDKLSKISTCGVSTPVLPGITPGSGPGHMALFGYNPVKYLLGRGVLEGLGINAQIDGKDVAARGNFCLTDQSGVITDRRAGRLSTNECKELVKLLNTIEIPGFDFEVYPVMDYRFVVVIKGQGVSHEITETDPQIEGSEILQSNPISDKGSSTSLAVNMFTQEAIKLLKNAKSRANGIILRGFSSTPTLPDFCENYKLNAACIAGYPMYRGVSGLLGMNVLECGQEFTDEFSTLSENFHKNLYDYYFVHYKPADSAGEDGNFNAKVQALETFDSFIPQILDLNPDVLVVAGDHSTPSYLSSHSWHPVPFLINSKTSQSTPEIEFNETSFTQLGSAGSISAEHLMLLVLAHAEKLHKFGP